MYLIAKGSLDELLWHLIKKKFRDLGEFVEGKEKMEIVVHHCHETLSSAIRPMYNIADKQDTMGEDDHFETLENTNFIQHELEEIAIEEQAMLKNNFEEDDLGEATCDESVKSRHITFKKPDVEQSQPTNIKTAKQTFTTGNSDKYAICLSDDEVEIASVKESLKKNKPIQLSDIIAKDLIRRIDSTTQFPRIQFYKVCFRGPKYNLALLRYSGRIIVQTSSMNAVKVSVGSIVVAVNGHIIQLNVDFKMIMKYLAHSISHSPVELTFAEDKDFAKFFSKLVKKNNVSKVNNEKKSEVVIDLIDEED